MAPRTKIDLTYVHLTHRPSTGKKKVHQVLLRHDNPKMSDFLLDQQEWVGFNAIHNIGVEVSKLPPGANVRFTEWRFTTSEAELFELKGQSFDKILLILGEEKVYWTFYMFAKERLICGSDKIDLTYCACCINEQYEGIINKVKAHILQKKPYFK